MIYSTEQSTSALTSEYNEKILNFDFSEMRDDDLFKGRLGVVNYLSSFYEATGDERYIAKISELLESVLLNIENKTDNNLLKNSTLLSGAAGLGFILKDFIKKELLDEDDFAEQLRIVDEIIFENTLKFISQEYYDYLSGPIGNLQYFLNSSGDHDVSLILKHLERSSKNGKEFYTQSENIFVQGYNFGLKHGHLGIVKTYLDYLNKYGENQYIVETIDRLLQNIINVLDFNYTIDKIHIFKYYNIYEENDNIIKRQNNRLSWCNSDLTFSYYLLKAGKLLKNQNYISLAEKIALETVKRTTFETTGIESHHFCHGSSGLAFLYDSLYKIDNRSEYNEASQYWIKRTREYLILDLYKDISANDLSWLYGGKLGALLVLNGMHNNNTLFKLLI
ncbi:lanthionine synthetase LanC family protein [Chryseobacterium paridis]|uniref:Lanthionine synthetase C-like protein n=1 Tax=Chryseobacterium paridis TaxID=2800328 RepID=A0ABS1FYJ7_9FLAO|nr:lanthionine synthetase LanC family protein [Chryseobacterium paridis]MBK1897535.1 hypothetical protein [Chryseobacterium paridis]